MIVITNLFETGNETITAKWMMVFNWLERFGRI